MITGAVIFIIGLLIGYFLSWREPNHFPKTRGKLDSVMKKIVRREAQIIDTTPLDLGNDN